MGKRGAHCRGQHELQLIEGWPLPTHYASQLIVGWPLLGGGGVVRLTGVASARRGRRRKGDRGGLCSEAEASIGRRGWPLLGGGGVARATGVASGRRRRRIKGDRGGLCSEAES